MRCLLLGEHVVWSRPNPGGGTIYYYYHDWMTWAVAALALAWLVWFFARGYTRARAHRRRPGRPDYGRLKRVVRLKEKLSALYLAPGFSANIHAVGVGLLGGGAYCIQVFISDPNRELWAGAGGEALPASYGGVPVVPVVAPRPIFLSGAAPDASGPWEQYAQGIRDRREVIVGGISGANTNLAGQSGTIGYFCTRRGRLSRATEPHILSCVHVLADLRRTDVDDSDLITQPSPGEAESNRPIGELVKFSPLKFDGDTNSPNRIDAAIARLWASSPHAPVIPLIGQLKGHVDKKDVRPGDPVRKCGRTTGYTEGCVFSIYLDIWVLYDRTGQSAFFRDQILIEPTAPRFPKFVERGDSGSMLTDAGQYAVGLVFAGVADVPESAKAAPGGAPDVGGSPAGGELKRIETYGVANPISEVLNLLKIELVV